MASSPLKLAEVEGVTVDAMAKLSLRAQSKVTSALFVDGGCHAYRLKKWCAES